MNLKRYRAIKIACALVAGTLIGSSLALGNYLFPIAVLVLLSLLMLILRGQVKEVLADERDYAVGGHAARWAIQIYSWCAVIGMFVLYAQKALNPAHEPMAMVLAYSTCALMILYSLLFRYYDKVKFLKTKTRYLVLGFALLMLIAVAGLRLLSGEDDWLCQDGQWIQHGHPSFPAPQTPCK